MLRGLERRAEADWPINRPIHVQRLSEMRLPWVCFYSEDKIKRQDVFLRLAKIHILATRLRDLETANTAVDEIIRYSNHEEVLPLSKTIKIVMQSTADDPPLRRLMVDFYVHEADPEAFDDDTEEMPNAFLVAVGKEFRKKVCENQQALLGTFLNSWEMDRSVGIISMMRRAAVRG